MPDRVGGTSAPLAGVTRRLVSLALACALALSTLVSSLVISELHEHDCAGKACPVCLLVEACQAVLAMAATAPTAKALVVAPVVALALRTPCRQLVLIAASPVSLKVRLII